LKTSNSVVVYVIILAVLHRLLRRMLFSITRTFLYYQSSLFKWLSHYSQVLTFEVDSIFTGFLMYLQ